MKNKLHLRDIPTKEVLEYQKKWCENRDLPFCYDALPYPSKLIYKKVMKLIEDGFLDFGVSPRTAWLTDKGEKFLKENI